MLQRVADKKQEMVAVLQRLYAAACHCSSKRAGKRLRKPFVEQRVLTARGGKQRGVQLHMQPRLCVQPMRHIIFRAAGVQTHSTCGQSLAAAGKIRPVNQNILVTGGAQVGFFI